jgi:hypothetical protein
MSTGINFGARSRRSSRIAKRLPIVIRWQPSGRDIEDDPALTVTLSRHGCSALCTVPVRAAQVYVLDPTTNRSAKAQVVYRRPSREGTEIALEFAGTDDFWGIEFLMHPQVSDLGLSMAGK